MTDFKDQVSVLSFPDSTVTKMEIISDQLYIHLDSAFIEGMPPTHLGPGRLIFQNIQNLRVHIYDSAKGEHQQVHDSISEPLADICECHFTDAVTRLAGFSQTSGKWVEWVIVGSLAKALFEIVPSQSPDQQNDIYQLQHPSFVVVHDLVFLKKQFAQTGYKRAKAFSADKIEYWMNMVLVDELFKTPNEALAFIENLAIYWGNELHKTFPSRKFQVEILDDNEIGLTFYQKL